VTVQRHIVIASVEPSIDCGRHPVKRIAGESLPVEACVFRDGSDVIRVVLKFRRAGERRATEAPMTASNPGLDLWRAEVPLPAPGRTLFTVEAWTDRFATWLDEFRRKVEGGLTDLGSEMAEGAALLDALAERGRGPDRKVVAGAAGSLRGAGDAAAALEAVGAPEVVEAAGRLQPRADAVVHRPELEVIADRPLARFGAWYEMFVRSQGTQPGRGGTFADAERRLPDIAAMGFDVVYLAPIHPIGRTGRKGPNNSLHAGPGDPGSPWAIGSDDGGYTAVEPALGTLDDFDRFVAAAARLGLEVALDLAIQCSPDHPWIRQHPEWFFRRPDGTLKYAENPPKKYEDIHPLNFDTEDRAALWAEMRDVLLFWIGHGVRIFRVDNPHTKPLEFWGWLLGEIRDRHPDVLFLSEAFTRPPMMKALAKVGFSQSYTYFTWRNTKAELTEYLTELADPGPADYFRPNFFANTPDILHEFLQKGGRPAFAIRLVLAGTLSPAYGIYSGFELCENGPLAEGTEDYKDSEKYQVRVRDWNAPGHIKGLVTRLNAVRRENPALQELANLRFLEVDNPQILSYLKRTPDGSNVVIGVVNLDPFHVQEGLVSVPLNEVEVEGDVEGEIDVEGRVGVVRGGRFGAHDLLTGSRYEWSERNYVRLDPAVGPAHVLRVEELEA
jgi:starch synthase (maltosyl-transferring)